MRALITRPAGLRLFHSTISRPQQRASAQQQGDLPEQKATQMALNNLAALSEDTPSTNIHATATNPGTQPPQEIFDAWKVTSFYAPLAFLRSRRMRDPPKSNAAPALGLGAAHAAYGDVFRQLDIEPVHEANNDILLSGFLTSMGKVKPRGVTCLSWRSQRKVTKAIKRSRQKGILPLARTNPPLKWLSPSKRPRVV